MQPNTSITIILFFTMTNSLLTKFTVLICLFFITTGAYLKAQKTVFNENFNAPGTAQSSSWTTNGQLNTSRWNVTRSGNDFGAKIDGGILTLSNDVSSTGNSKGWVLASTTAANFSPGFNPILSQNPGIVSWTFNMRQIRTNPAGLTNGNYGVGYILAGTAGSTNALGKGYAIMLGQSGTKDAIRLATYNNGIATYYTKLSSNTSGLNDFGRDYTSIRVEYNPVTNEWSVYVRKDNSTSFNDPKSGTLVYQGKISNSEFVNESLPMTGGYWSAATGSRQTAFFDNISVDVVVPEIIAINPDSKIANSGAFNLIIDGKGFTQATKVYWDGVIKPTTFLSSTQLAAGILATDIQLPRILPITVKSGSFESNAIDFEIEPSGVPALTVSRNTLPSISTVQGTASIATESYTINGINLTSSATITAPANFEISVKDGPYSNTHTLANSSGILTGQPLTLKARLKASAPAGNFSGNITHTTTGAVTKQVAVSGRVLATEPTANASGISFTNITSTGFKLNWTNGNGSGDQRLVLIREALEVNGLPIDATTYSASSAFANGAEIGTGNYVVYKGTGNNVQITSLQPNTTYHISVVEFNGAVGTENYRTSGLIGNIGNTKTLNSPAGLQLKIADTSYKIDFDNTVDGVNLDTFQGSGIAKIAETGQLDSDSWAFTDFAKGNVNFGGESTEDSSYENGASDGNEVDTGIYAFNVGTTEAENFTLGIQPGGSDFNPGTITLKIHNQTGVPMTSVNIGYKVYIYNDQPSSSQIRFSSSSNGTSFIDQSIVDVISPTTADLAPGWKAYYRVITIPGLNIAKDTFYYIRWSGSLISGTGAQDEFAIDDIEVIANPTTNNVAFEGITEDFVLQGNANLSSDLSVQKSIVFNGGKLAIKDKTLTIGGNVTNTTSSGLIGGTNSNLIIRGTKNPSLSFDQTASGNELQNFSLVGADANTVTLTNPLTVNQLLQVDELQILNLGSFALNGTLNSILNNGIIQTQNTTATPFTSGITWNGTGVLNLNATSTAQTLVEGTYNNLTLSSTGGTIAAANVTVNGILNLPNVNASTTKGSLDMATHTLLMGPEGTNIGKGDVTGIIRRNSFTTNKLYTFGHPNSSIIFPGGGTTLPTTMSAKLTLGAAPTWRTGAIKRYYDIIQTGAVSTKAIIRQHYLESELNGNAETKLVFWGHKAAGALDFEQGKSSNNVTDNWVEISNANVAQYFGNEFDKVFITLDDTQGVEEIVWDGSESDSWTTLENWTQNVKPGPTTKVIIPAGVPNYPTLNPSETIGSLIIETGAIVNSTDTSLLFLSDGAGAWQNYGTFNPGTGTSTITFNNLDATIAGSTTFNNINIPSGAGIRPAEGNKMKIAGTLTNNGTMFTTLIPNTIEFIGSGQTIPNVNGLDFGGYHNLIVSGTGISFASTITTLNVRGNLIVNQPVSFSGKTINMTGLSEQGIGGTAAINFNNLIVNKETGAVVLAKDISVDGTLTLTKGNLVLGEKNLSLGSNEVAGNFGTDTMIVADGSGTVKRKFATTGSYLFPIGELTGAPSYSPINVALTEGTFAADAFVGVNVVDAKHPQNFSSQDFISRYWNVTQTGISNAVATITGTYDPLDFNGEESAIAAAQLQGSFDLTNNPWTKFTSLANNTLFAEGAVLNSGQNSVFTGIKAGAFSVEVYGYGDFCLGSEVEIEAVVTNGDAPFTYQWSDGLPNSATVTIPTNVVGTTDYTITVIDANGLRATDNNISVDIFPQTVGGSISANTQVICAGSQPNDLELIESVGKILYWQSSTDISFAVNEGNTNNVINISNFKTTLPGSQIGPINQTTYFRAVLQNGDCAEQFSTIATVTVKSTTWDGTVWSNGEPNSSTTAIFAANYNAFSDFNACSIVVGSGKTITIPENKSMTIQNNITNNGNIIVKSDGNLIQVNDNGIYIGDPAKFTVERQAVMKRLDYIYWSSPVQDRLMTIFSPQTVKTRFLQYNEDTDKFTSVANIDTAVFVPGKGYAVRAPNNHNYPAGTVEPWLGFFKGTPNNGPISFELKYSKNGYNLVGNPYASNVLLGDQNSVKDLFHLNSSTIESIAYFWTNVVDNVPEQGGTAEGYNGANYASYNLAGGLGASGNANVPNGIVKVGQGFIVKAKPSANSSSLVFNNSMRSNGTSIFFNKNTNQEKDRFWLKMQTPDQNSRTLLVAYVAGATDGFEYSYDAPLLSLGSDALYSVLNDQKLGIQGRQYPLNIKDVVTLGTNSYVAGDYVISLQETEGIFANGQNIYLKDNQNNTVTNLSAENYTFTATAGLTEGRFEITYQTDNVLGTDSTKKDELVVYREGTDFIVKSAKNKISELEVYDTSGRLMIKLKPNETEVRIDGQSMINGVYILKINQNGKITTRKIIR